MMTIVGVEITSDWRILLAVFTEGTESRAAYSMIGSLKSNEIPLRYFS